jgi:hypothetical protein
MDARLPMAQSRALLMAVSKMVVSTRVTPDTRELQ